MQQVLCAMYLPHAKDCWPRHPLRCAAAGVCQATPEQAILRVISTSTGLLPIDRLLAITEELSKVDCFRDKQDCSPWSRAACRSGPRPQHRNLALPPCSRRQQWAGRLHMCCTGGGPANMRNADAASSRNTHAQRHPPAVARLNLQGTGATLQPEEA